MCLMKHTKSSDPEGTLSSVGEPEGTTSDPQTALMSSSHFHVAYSTLWFHKRTLTSAIPLLRSSLTSFA